MMMWLKSVLCVVGLPVVLLCAIFASCGHDNPPEGELNVHPSNAGATSQGTSPGNGERPGASDANSLSAELKDEVWRVPVGDVTLRYDRGGVLFAVSTDGAVSIHDLDGADEVTFTPGIIRADSVLSGASITVNGHRVVIENIKMMRRGERRIWYKVTYPGDIVRVMVLP